MYIGVINLMWMDVVEWVSLRWRPAIDVAWSEDFSFG